MNRSHPLLRARRAVPSSRQGRPLVEPLEARINPAAGMFDPSFGGGDGIASAQFDVDALQDDFYAVVEQTDGKFVAVGASADFGSRFSPDLAVARFNADGTLDTTFGNLGKVVLGFGGTYHSKETAYTVALDGDGKIVLAGSARVAAGEGTSTDFFVARLTTSGALDTTFGGTGFVLTDFGQPVEETRAVTVQGDGKIVVAGTSGGDVALARYTALGVLDTTFDTDGKVTTDLGGADRANGIALQTDGKIVIGGTNGVDFAAVRYTTSGVLDTTFSGDGIATADLGTPSDIAVGIAIDSVGNIVLAGAKSFDVGVARFTSAGLLDASFGAGGITLIDPGNDFYTTRGIAVLPDDRIVVGGGNNNGDLFTARLTSSGGLDASFGTGGVALANFTEYQTANGVLALADGSVIVAASSFAASRDASLAKFTPTGAIDTAFSGDGLASASFFRDAPAQPLAALLQPDGKYIVAGNNGLGDSRKDGVMARFNTDGTLDTTFGVGGTAVLDIGMAESINALVFDAGTNTILVGATMLFGPEGSNMLVARYDLNGVLVPAFGTNGIAEIHFGGHESVSSLAVAADGKVVVGGAATNYAQTIGGATLVRLNANGTLDTTFDGDGQRPVALGPTVQQVSVLADGRIVFNFGGGIARLLADGTFDTAFSDDGILSLGGRGVVGMIVAADGAVTYGASFPRNAFVNEFEIRRVLADGLPDTAFGSGGVVRDSASDTAGHIDNARAFIVDSMGRFVIATGTTTDKTGIVRLNADGTRDLTFGEGGFTEGPGALGLSQRADGRILSAKAGPGASVFGITFQAAQLLDDPESSPNGIFRIDGFEFIVRENQGPVQIVVKRVGGTTGAVSVDYTTVAGTALAGGDFTMTSGTLNFADGDMEETIVVPLTVDQNGEAEEQFRLVLSNPQGGALLDNPRTALVTIPLHVGPSGGRDTGYGELGFAVANVINTAGINFEAVTDIERDAQGRVLVFGGASAAGVFGQFVVRFLPDGTLDTSLSKDGIVFNDLTGFGGEISAGLVQTDGKILTIGRTIEGVSQASTQQTIGLTRYLDDGAIDRTFGDNGFITVTLPNSSSEFVRDAVLLADGKFLVATTSSVLRPESVATDSRARVLRFNADGTLDATFGVNGIAQTPEAQETIAFSLAVLGNGDILLGHSSEEAANNSRNNLGLTRFNADGSADTVFGTGGVVSIDTAANASETLPRVLVQPDGKIVIAGADSVFNRQVVVRLSDTGVLDPTFGGGDGIAFGATATLSDVLLLPSGRIVLLGAVGSTPSRTLTQFNADGSLDGTFGIGGTVAIGTGVNSGQPIGRILLEPDNAVLAAFDARFTGEVGSHANVTLTRIFTEPRPGKFSFSEAEVEVDENGRAIELSIIRTDGAEGDVLVNYNFTNGTATGGADFTGINGTVNFLQGETIKTISIPILDDTTSEGRESFTVTLSGAPLGAVATSTITIVDGPGVFQFGAPQIFTAEGISTVSIPVTRTGGSDGVVTVQYDFADITAVLGTDYVGGAGVLNFADQQTTGFFNAFIRNDNVVEGRESFTVRLSQATGGAALGAQSTTEVVIFDSEPASGAGAGSLDRTFGTDGVLMVDVVAGDEERSWDVATLPDGRILAVGESGGQQSDFLLVRFTTTGALDTTWGGDGTVQIDFGGVESARSVTILSDGKVLVAGFALFQGEGDFAIAQLNPDGSLDLDFSLDGKVTIDFGKQDDRALDMVVQGDGKIVLGGSSGNALGRDMAAARLNADGSLDNTFSGDGRATVDFDGRFDVGWSVAVDSKGRVVLAGESIVNNTGPGGFVLSPSESARAAVARLLANGTLDPSFSSDGKVLDATADPVNSRLRKVLIRPGDAITAIGFVNADFLKFEYNEAGLGNPDIGFNFGVGTVQTNFPRVGGSGGNGFDRALDAAFAPDGSLLVAGWSGLTSDFLGGDLALVKFQPKGLLDTSFAVRGQGFLETAPPGQGVALTSDGHIVTVGPKFEISRVLGESIAPPQGVFQLNTLGLAVEETTSSLTFTVERPRGASAGQVSVSYTTIGGTALPGLDFTPVSGTLVFEESETTKTFSVSIINDTQRELAEQFTVLLFGATGGATLSSFRSAGVTINANDSTGSFGTFGKGGQGGGIGFDFASETGFAFISVSRSSGVGTVTLDWATVDGTAKAGEDYKAATGTVTLGPGVTVFDFAIVVDVIPDTDIEGAEDFFIEFSNPTGGASLDGSFGLRRVVIPDNDPLVHNNASRLDTTFDTDGRLITSFGQTGPETAFAVARDANGKLVVVGQGGNAGGIAIARYNADGTLDTTFDGDGKALIDIGPAGERGLDVNIRPDGKILVFARASAPVGATNPTAVVARLNADGSLDASFGTGGMATLALRAPFTIQDVESGPDGKFVVSGWVNSGIDLDVAVLRFTANGVLDTTFSDDGMRVFDTLTATDVPYGLAIQADGKILLTVQANDLEFANDRDVDRTFRLNVNGTLDTTFANGGMFSARLMEFFYPGDADASGSTFYSGIAVQPDGKIVLAGTFNAREVPSLAPGPNGHFGQIVTRLNTNGTLDTSFGTGGHAFIEAPADPVASYNPLSLFAPRITFNADGKIYISGSGGTTGAAAVVRLLADGRMDIGFGKGGVQELPFSTPEPFSAIQDILVQPDGRVVIVGGNPFVTSDTDFSVARFIGGPDSGDFRLLSSAYKVSEDGTSITIKVERVTGFDGPASVTLTQDDGTALAGVDYTLTTQTLSWGAFEAGVKTVTIPILNDALAQGDLTFTVRLTNPTNGSELSPVNSAPVTIIDDENKGEFNFRIVNWKADENGGMATIVVDRLKGKGGVVTVDYAATAGGTPATGTATAGVDFTPVNGTLTFGDGVTSQMFTVPVLNDGVLDFDKTVVLMLSNPSVGAALGADTARLTIVDDEKPTGGVFDFSLAEYVVSEDGTGIFVTITRTGGMGEATVVFTATPGTATVLDDYGPVSGTLLFEVGVTSQQVFIPIFDDALAEGDETISLSLSNPTGDLVATTRVTPTLGLANATLRIADNDPALAVDGGFFELTGATFSGVEKSGKVQIFITRVGGSTGAATVDVQLTPGTASAVKDFTATTITAVFGDGEVLAVIDVPVRKDLLSEANEAFTVTLANTTGSAFLGDLTTATATIIDDDARALPDIDGDGDLDLVLLKKGRFYVHLNPGDGNYPVINPKNPADAAKIVATVKSPTSFVFGDFDGDGNDDLAVLSAKRKTISLLLGNDDGSFDAPVAFLSGPQTPGKTTTSVPIKKGLLVADFDGDGRLDLAGMSSKGINVLLNTSAVGAVSFAPAVQAITGKGFASLYAGDFNGDNDPDLAAFKGGKKPTVSVFEGDGAGGFAALPFVSKVPKGMKAIQLTDVNGDERLDIVAIFPKNHLGFVAGAGNGLFGPSLFSKTIPNATVLIPTDPKPLVFGFSDVDDDLDLDLVAINAKRLATVLVNSNAGFAKQPAVATLFKPAGVVVADVNGDDDPDLVLFDKSDRFKVIRGGAGATFPVV